MGGVDFSLWVFESGEATVVVAGDKEPHDGAELFDVAREAASAPVKRWDVTAQIGVCAFDGVGLFFARCHVVTGGALALAINEFVVSGQVIAVELMHPRHQRKHPVHQRLHRLEGALLDNLPSQDTARLAIDNGG